MHQIETSLCTSNFNVLNKAISYRTTAGITVIKQREYSIVFDVKCTKFKSNCTGERRSLSSRTIASQNLIITKVEMILVTLSQRLEVKLVQLQDGKIIIKWRDRLTNIRVSLLILKLEGKMWKIVNTTSLPMAIYSKVWIVLYRMAYIHHYVFNMNFQRCLFKEESLNIKLITTILQRVFIYVIVETSNLWLARIETTFVFPQFLLAFTLFCLLYNTGVYINTLWTCRAIHFDVWKLLLWGHISSLLIAVGKFERQPYHACLLHHIRQNTNCERRMAMCK